MRRVVTRGLAAAGVAVLSFGMMVSGAGAHIGIDTFGELEQGSFAKLGFSVPNERDNAGTVTLKVQLPQDHPLAFVSTQPKEGWEITTTTRKLDTPIDAFGASVDEVVDTITWTATGETQIGPGQFEVFWVSLGVMPTGVDTLAFPAIQTYSSGEVVEWIDATPEGGEEPEHPAPTVALVAASGEGAHDGGDSAAIDADEAADDDDEGQALSVIALVVGALGLLVGAAALVTARRRVDAASRLAAPPASLG